MILPDIINGGFEAFGSIAVWANIRTILKEKQVRGYRSDVIIFFTSWSLWNMYYYPHLSQYASMLAGASLGLANLVYAFLVVHYRRYNAKIDS